MKSLYSANPDGVVIKFLSHNVNTKETAELTNTIKARRLTSKGRIASIRLIDTASIQ